MKVKLRTLVIAWCLLFGITLWMFVDSLSANITRPLIGKSELRWSSYHAYKLIEDRETVKTSDVRDLITSARDNEQWARKTVKKLKLMKLKPRKRVRRIFDYVYWTYTYDRTYTWLEQARVAKRANCSAYADSFYALCKASNIPVRYVIGWADNGRNAWWHAWNRVRINKKWYWVDPTWGRWISRKLWSSHSQIVEEW